MRDIRRAFGAALVTLAAIVIVFAGQSFNHNTENPKPPMTEKNPKTTKIHDQTMVDDYFWLREKTNPAVLSHAL